MKKKLLTIIVVVILCLSIMSLCFVGCKKDNNGGNQQQQGGGEQGGGQGGGEQGGGEGGEQGGQAGDPSAADLEQYDYVLSYAGAWVTNNAEKNPSASDLNKGLNAVKSKWSNVKKIVVSESGANFEIAVTFKDNTSKNGSVKKVSLDANRFVAGIPYAATNTVTKFDDVFVPVYNGLMKTIKTAVENGTEFAEDEEGNKIFSASAELDLALFVGPIGDLFGGFEAPFEYGLRIKGNVGREAKDTQVALEMLQAEEPIIGLYYIGAEAKDACKLYLGIDIGDYHARHFIDNADLNALVIGLIESMEDKGEAQLLPVDDDPAAGEEEDETPFYDKEISSFADFLGGFNLDATVGQLVNSVIGSVLKDNMGWYAIDGGKMYQIRVQVGALLDQVLGIDMVGTIVTNLVQNVDLLKDLDVSTMQGIGGNLILSVAVMNDGTLGGLELSYNVDERDFRFNASDTIAKKYGPINLALSIKDFSLGEQEVEIGIGQQNDYTYFSPLNFDGEADYTATITIDEDPVTTAYHARLQSNINPFDLENGEFLLTVDVIGEDDSSDRLFSLYGDLFWDEEADGFGLDAELEIFYDGEFASTTVSDQMFWILMY
ncbi:MAG: hypothetical protein J5755_03690, partial [Clostridia bacterium]|nr:hypothetical protein [Clostridia bacterium]